MVIKELKNIYYFSKYGGMQTLRIKNVISHSDVATGGVVIVNDMLYKQDTQDWSIII